MARQKGSPTEQSNGRLHIDISFARAEASGSSLFDKVCDTIGTGIQYVQRDVMGDIGAKLVDEMWFGAARSHAPNSFSEKGQPARTTGSAPGSMEVHAELDRDARSQPIEPDLDR